MVGFGFYKLKAIRCTANAKLIQGHLLKCLVEFISKNVVSQEEKYQKFMEP
jgi:hypothetical protein